jgi:hypothetical protein
MRKKQSRIFDSMAAAAAALGVSMETMKAAKQSPDCHAFHASRVNETEFLDWASKHEVTTASDVMTLKDQKTQEEIRKLKIKNDKDQGKLILKTEVAAAIRRALGRVSSIVEAKLVLEYPTVVSGMDPDAVRVFGRRLHDLIMAECQGLAKEFPE